MSILLDSVKSISQVKADWKNLVQAIPCISPANQKLRDASQVSITSKLTNLPTEYWPHHFYVPPTLWQAVCYAHQSLCPNSPSRSCRKDRFYTDLQSVLINAPAKDKIVILRDFNTRVGQDVVARKGVLGQHGIGNCNDSAFCLNSAPNSSFLSWTHFTNKRTSWKATWMHPQSKHWHMLDYILVCHWDMRDILHTRIMPSAEYHIDHHLVHCKLNIHVKPMPKIGRGNHTKQFKVCSLRTVRPKKNSRGGYSPDIGILTMQKTQSLICYGATWS